MIDISKLKTISNSAFKKRVNELAESAKTVSEKAHLLGLLGLKKASEHGDFTQLSEILKVNLRGIRRKALIHWVKTYSPAKYQAKKEQFVKDKSDDANEFDLEGANENPFWVLSKEKIEGDPLDLDKFIRALRSNVSRKITKAQDNERVTDDELGKLVQASDAIMTTLDTVEEQFRTAVES